MVHAWDYGSSINYMSYIEITIKSGTGAHQSKNNWWSDMNQQITFTGINKLMHKNAIFRARQSENNW